MIVDKKHFYLGLSMSLIFVVILYLMFSNLFGGTNAFHYSDSLFNSISKGSTNYFQMLEENNKSYANEQVALNLSLPEAVLAPALNILQTKGFQVQQQDGNLRLEDNLGAVIGQVLSDAKVMFHNDESSLVSAYNMEGKKVLLVWWEILKSMDKELKVQKKFQAAKFITDVSKRGVEVAYNYYGIESQKATERFGILSFSLVFYVIYTVWWGFSIFFLFEGIGLVMASKEKQES